MFPPDASRETIVFKGTHGKMKLEGLIRPKILDKKVHYHRKRPDSWIEYQTDDKEMRVEVKLCIWETGIWREISLEALGR